MWKWWKLNKKHPVKSCYVKIFYYICKIKYLIMLIKIYSLNDPITNEVKYIGRTSKPLNYRLSEHVSPSYSNHNTYKKNWIRNLINRQLTPTINLIKEVNCTWEESHIIEISIIEEYFKNGAKLVNLVDKGAGGFGISIKKPTFRKPILQYDLEGNFIKEWNGIITASNFFNTNPRLIFKAVKGISIKTSNFMWKYKLSDDFPLKISSYKELKGKGRRNKIIQYSQKGDFMKIYDSYRLAAIAINAKSESNISEATIKKYLFKGFQWRKYSENYPLKINEYLKKSKTIKAVGLTISLNFNSLVEASKYFGVSCFKIKAWCLINKEQFGYKFYFN